MTDPRLVTVRPGAATPVIYAADGPALLRNRDPAVTVYLGDEGMSPGDTTTHILDPLGTLSVTGDRDWWGITAAASAIVQSTPAAVDSNVSPSQIAAQIALAGISSPVPSLLQAQQTIAPNTSFGPINVAFPNGGSYLIVLNTTGGNAQIADIGIAHMDGQGNQVYFEEFNVGVGTVGNGSPVIIRGNLQAPNLSITGLTCTLPFLNGLGLTNGPFTLGPLQLTVYSTALAVAEARPKMIPSNVQGGYLVGFQGVALAAGAQSGPLPIPAYSGRAIVDVTSPGTLARGTLQGFRVVTGATPVYTQRINQVTAGSTAVNELIIPQMFTTLLLLNGDSVARTPTLNLIAADYI